LIIGAGDAGEKLARHIIASPNIPYSLEGFIDDNSMKQGVLIHGIKVLGKIKDIPKIVIKKKLKKLLLPSPLLRLKL